MSTETKNAWREGQKESDQTSNAAATKYYEAANGCRIALGQVDIAEIPIGPKINS